MHSDPDNKGMSMEASHVVEADFNVSSEDNSVCTESDSDESLLVA